MLEIDNLNISDFSCFLLNDWADLVSFPPIKNIVKNDWAEENGIEIDNATPVLNKREIEFSFLIGKTQYDIFIDFLKEKTHREFLFLEINQRFSFRFVAVTDYKEFPTDIECKIKFVEDNPSFETDFLPLENEAITSDWKINDISFSAFGVRVLQGSEKIYQRGEIKSILETSNSITNGVKTQAQPLFFKAQKTTLKLFLCAEKTDFFRRYYAFFKQWLTPNLKELNTQKSVYLCHYENSKVTTFFIQNHKIYCDFDFSITHFQR